MSKDTSILLVANARPFEIRKLYFFRDLRMRRLMEQSSERSIEPPSLRRWIESAAWLDTNSKESLTGRAEGEKAREELAAIDAATSEAVAGICTEAQRLGRRSSSNVADDLGSALKDLSTIAEQIREDWNVRSRG